MTTIKNALSGVLPVPETLANRPPRALSEDPTPDWDEIWERHRFALGQPAPKKSADVKEPDPRDLATGAALALQEGYDLDILGEGGLAEDHAVLPLLRHLAGIDLEPSLVKAGAYLREIDPQRLIAPPSVPDRRFLRDRWRRAQRHSTRPVKVSLPGPLALAGVVDDRVYGGEILELATAFAEALNPALRDLADAGCPEIEIAEPALLTDPSLALSGGLEALDRLWHRTEAGMRTWLRLVAADRAPPWQELEPLDTEEALLQLANGLENIRLGVLAIEAPSENALQRLGRLGAVQVALVQTETDAGNAREAEDRLRATVEVATGHLAPDRLILAADGGRFALKGALQQRLARLVRASRLA